MEVMNISRFGIIVCEKNPGARRGGGGRRNKRIEAGMVERFRSGERREKYIRWVGLGPPG